MKKFVELIIQLFYNTSDESIFLFLATVILLSHSVINKKEVDKMGQSIQEWTKWNLWKTAFKNLKWYGLLKQAVFHKFHLVYSWIFCPIWSTCFLLITKWLSLDTSAVTTSWITFACLMVCWDCWVFFLGKTVLFGLLLVFCSLHTDWFSLITSTETISSITSVWSMVCLFEIALFINDRYVGNYRGNYFIIEQHAECM